MAHGKNAEYKGSAGLRRHLVGTDWYKRGLEKKEPAPDEDTSVDVHTMSWAFSVEGPFMVFYRNGHKEVTMPR